MAKNKALIEQMKLVRKTINDVTPSVYAGVALALHRKHGWGFKRINDLFSESQEIWHCCVENGESMTDLCLRETGIEVENKVRERRGVSN